MKKLFFTFIALLIVFFSAWGIKLRMPINRPNNVQGEQQVAWYETRYTAPTAEEEWTLDPEIPVNYLPVAGEDEVYMVLDDSGNIVGYRHRTQQEDGSWLWTDIEDPNAEHYEKVDGLDHIYKVTDKDGISLLAIAAAPCLFSAGFQTMVKRFLRLLFFLSGKTG